MLTVLGALFFAAAGYLGVVLAATMVARIRRFDDGPEPAAPPITWIIIASAIVGAIVTSHLTSPVQIAFFAILCVALVAIWCADVSTGIIPDVLTLGPLAIIALVAVLQHEWAAFASMLIPALPFSIAAVLSRGRGMGWGDVKLVALGGAVLGAPAATLAFAIACGVAVVLAYAKKRTLQPIAFAPYLVAAIAITIPLAIAV